MKKILSLVLTAAFLLTSSPWVAFSKEAKEQVFVKEAEGKEVIEPQSKMTLAFEEDFDVNEAAEGDLVYFSLYQAVVDDGKIVLPKGTRFVGKVIQKQDSKWGFRRARATLDIYKLVLPDGRVCYIRAKSDSSKGELVSPAALNALKGVGTFSAGAFIAMFTTAVVAIETLSIGGLFLAPFTGAAAGIAITTISKGLNYRVAAGTPLNIIFEAPVAIDLININVH